MAMEILRELATQRLPLTVKDEAVVDQIRLLRAADLVASLTSAPGSTEPFGTVFCLTKRGREALKPEAQQKTP